MSIGLPFVFKGFVLTEGDANWGFVNLILCCAHYSASAIYKKDTGFVSLDAVPNTDLNVVLGQSCTLKVFRASGHLGLQRGGRDEAQNFYKLQRISSVHSAFLKRGIFLRLTLWNLWKSIRLDTHFSNFGRRYSWNLRFATRRAIFFLPCSIFQRHAFYKF